MVVERSKGFLRVHSNLHKIIEEIHADCPQKRFGKYQVYVWKMIAYLCHSVMNGKLPNYSLPSHINIDKVFIPVPLPVHRIIENPTKSKIRHFQEFVNKNWKLFFRIKIRKNFIILYTCFAIFVGLRIALRHQKGFVKIPFKDFNRIENIFDFICVFYKNSLCKKYDEIVFNKVIREWSFVFNRYRKRDRYKLFSQLKRSASKFGFRFFTMDDSNILYLKDFRNRRRYAPSPQRSR